MTQLRVRPGAADERGAVIKVTPESAGWKYVGFELVKLAPGQVFNGGGDKREFCLVLVSGTADVVAGDERFEAVGGRATPFEEQAPGAVYIPAKLAYSVSALDAVELAVCSAPGGAGAYPPRLIESADMSREVRGTGSNTRYIRNILPDTQPADSLLVVEVITPSGHWSSYPPHKHDTDIPGKETALEETYYHRLQPPQGFAFQRVYTDDRSIDEAMTVEDGDVVLAPRGYHPVGAAYGYDLYYLNVMAGPKRKWQFSNDAAHEWILSTS